MPIGGMLKRRARNVASIAAGYSALPRGPTAATRA